MDHGDIDERLAHVQVLFIVLGQPTIPRQPAKRALNGLIITDKFCLSRWGQLQLSWSRVSVRSAVSRTATAYAPDEVSHRGGGHEASVADLPDNGYDDGRPAALGSGLSTPPALRDATSAGHVDCTGPGATLGTGGRPCA